MALTRLSGNVIKTGSVTGNNFAANAITNDKIAGGATIGGYVTMTLSYPTGTSANTQGNQTITITGRGFVTGTSVYVGKTPASVVTVANTTQLTFTSPAKAAGRYVVYVVGPDGSVALFAPGILYA